MRERIISAGIAVLICLLMIGSAAYGQLKVVNDPAQIGVGARSLGMGGVLLNFSDIASLFGNPASLVHVEKFQYTLMSGKFLNEVDYYSLGVVFPTGLGRVGVGYSLSQLSLSGPLPTTEIVDGIRIIPSTTEVRSDIYSSSTILLLLSKPAKDFVKIGLFERMLLGGTFKIFSQDLSATGVSGNAQGYELDLGIQYQFNPNLRFSLMGKNLLPASMGGKLVWHPTDREEAFPYYIKTGLQFDLDGEIKILNLKKQSLIVAIEYDHHPRGNAPDLFHYGLELGLSDILSVRVGRDQGYIGRGGTSVFDIANNLTYGVGVSYKGWRFDYAFHEYYEAPDNNTHYFSLTYGLPYVEEKKVEPEKIIVSPEDKIITTFSSFGISGRIVDREIASVLINNKPVEIKESTFSTTVDLSLGKNKILITGLNKKGEVIYTGKRRVLRLIGFEDVPEKYWAKDSIRILATLGIVKGYPDGTFRPEMGVSRAEFVTLLARLAGEEKYQYERKLPFTDLLPEHWAYRAVAYGLDQKLVKGYPDGTFRPNKKISRAEGVAVVARFAGLDLETPVDEIPYSDIPGRHWAIREISAAKTAGLLEHIKTRFYPNEELTRGETAEILTKVKLIKERVDDLLDFEKGYE